MTYGKDTGGVSARYRQAGQVEQLNRGGGGLTRFVAPGSVTNGQFGLFEWSMPPRSGGADPHFHKTFSESFYVTLGTVSLILFAPGAPREKYFRELVAIREEGRQFSDEEWAEFLAHHDQYRAQ